ncbi:hypothetical protein C8J55DRAFT_17339 [Lentinula edodes]|uniref:Uncharacterized protein n=1 Tax=Lentinula lateritia TaxID=40482 RepID=A0A9W9B208_9AGAR|nr:hypothetical protein C8J55DRAFT_17339 [Lentinula edodes]
MLDDILAGVNDGRLRSPFDVVGRFLEGSRATHFSSAFAELFQGMVLRNADDGQDGEMLLDSDGSRPIVSWPLDSHPNTVGGVRVTLNSVGDQNRTGDMPPIEPINNPRQASGRNSSPSRPVSGTNGDAIESDNSMPSLNEVSDSDDESLEWSDDDPEYESNTPFVSSSATYPPPRAQEPRGRFLRAILVPRRGVIRPQYLPRGTIVAGDIADPTPSTSTTTSNNDLLPLQSVSRLENHGHEKQDEADYNSEDQHENGLHFDRTHATADLNTNVMPPLERRNEGSYPQGVTASRFDPQPLSETLIPSDIAAGASDAPPEDDDERHDMLVVPPFTTDGRGRVIAASDEDARDGRSF